MFNLFWYAAFYRADAQPIGLTFINTTRKIITKAQKIIPKFIKKIMFIL